MKHYLLFAGTTEGRQLTEFLIEKEEVQITACTATEYGKILLPSAQNLTVLSQRLDLPDMIELISQNHFDAVIDTTHPYAVIVSENIRNAAAETNCPYYRVIRPEEDYQDKADIVYVSSMEEAVSYLETTTGNILCTTGSKELASMCKLSNYQERVYARILSNPEMVSMSFDLGFQGKHLICMQGPFSEELNTALIHQFQISYVLTKNSGKLGGFLEKVNSAKATNSTLVIIGRPTVEDGYSLEEIKELLGADL